MNTSTKPHIATLDGLRGLAILMVFLLHTVILPSSGYDLANQVREIGRFGVDLFFCLSGFLITGILFRAKCSTTYFRDFYMRRTLRVFPLYYFFLVLYWLLVVHFHVVRFGADKGAQAQNDLHWAWFYATNISILVHGHYVVASLNHFWTLAVEEHFYLFWPMLVLILPRRRLLWATGLIAVGALALRTVMTARGVSDAVIMTFTLYRIDAFAMGAAAALLLAAPASGMLRRYLGWAVAGSLLLSCVAGLLPYRGFLTVGYTAVAMFFTSLIAACVVYERSPALAVFRAPVMRFLGKYSYAIYVFHFPIQIGLERKLPTAALAARTHSLVLGIVLHAGLVAVLSIGVALLTWNLFEKRFLRLKRFFEPRKKVVVAKEIPEMYAVGGAE